MCVVPWCEREPEDVHHIIERSLWDNGGYIKQNGASVCERHHRHAEKTLIPPQAFWMWIGVSNPVLPEGVPENVNKWGDEIKRPSWKEYREYVKYPSTRHLPFSNVGDQDDTYHRSVETFLDVPLVVTQKADGSNAMLIKDLENPVRARNGKKADHKSFSHLKEIYWNSNIHSRMPENIQVFGEWLYAKHSIHYGCDCDTECEDVGPNLTDMVDGDYGEKTYFQVFGAYNMEYDTWLSWSATEKIAESLGFPTVPVLKLSKSDEAMYSNQNVFYDDIYKMAKSVIDRGGEGLVVRSKYPFYYGEFGERLGKYVRKNHVKTDKHWEFQEIVQNQL